MPNPDQQDDQEALPEPGNSVETPEISGSKIGSAICGSVALLWGIWVVREILANSGAGPPLGALCMALPSFALLIIAGAIWPTTSKSK